MTRRGPTVNPLAERSFNAQDAGMAKTQEKAERLAAALRENLRKRKAQARVVAQDSERAPTQEPNG